MHRDFKRLMTGLAKYKKSLKTYLSAARTAKSFTSVGTPGTRKMTPQSAAALSNALEAAFKTIEAAIEEAPDEATKTNIRDAYIGRSGLSAFLDTALMETARKELATHTKPMREATKKLIALLGETRTVAAFLSAHPPERLAVYRDLLPLLPVIDTFDPQTDISLRFSQSGRQSAPGVSILSLETIATTFSEIKVRVSLNNSDTIVWTGDATDPTFATDIARYKRLFPKPKKGWKFQDQPGDLAGTLKVMFDISVPVLSVATMYLENYADASADAAKHQAELAHIEQIVKAILPLEADMKLAKTGGTIGIDFKKVLTEAQSTEFNKTMKQAKAAQFALSLKALGIFDALYAFNKEALKPGTSDADKRQLYKTAAKAVFATLDGVADIVGRVTARSAIGAVGGAIFAIPLLALDADAAYASIDAATRAGDMSVALGDAIALAGSTALAMAGVMMLYAEFAAASTFGGPVAIGVTLVVGLALLIAGKTIAAAFIDTPMEAFAKNCAFGLTPEDQPNDPLKAHYEFGINGNPNMGVQKDRLFELMNPLGLSYNSTLKTLTLAFTLDKITKMPKNVSIDVGWVKTVGLRSARLNPIPENASTAFNKESFWKGQSFLENIPANMAGAFVEARVKLPAGTMRNWVKLP